MCEASPAPRRAWPLVRRAAVTASRGRLLAKRGIRPAKLLNGRGLVPLKSALPHTTRHNAPDGAAPWRMSPPISAVDEIGTRLPVRGRRVLTRQPGRRAPIARFGEARRPSASACAAAERRARGATGADKMCAAETSAWAQAWAYAERSGRASPSYHCRVVCAMATSVNAPRGEAIKAASVSDHGRNRG